MLRRIINQHTFPRIIPFQITTTSAPSAVANIGYGDITVTRGGTAGAGTIVPKVPFRRPGLMFLTQSNVDGGYATFNATTNTSGASFAYSMLDGGGAATDGSCEGFLFGWDGVDQANTINQNVVGSANAIRIIWTRIAADTSILLNTNDFSCERTSGVGAGGYTVTFKRAFAKTPVVMITSVNPSTVSSPKIVSKSASNCVYTLANQAGALADKIHYLMAIGQYSTSDAGRLRCPVQCSQRKNRILAFQITNTSGSWTKTIGSSDLGNLTDSGVGSFSVILTKPFTLKNPAAFVCTTTQRGQVNAALSSSGSASVCTKNAAGGNADTDGVSHVFIIGSDESTDY